MTQTIQEEEEDRIARLLFSVLGIGPIVAIRRGNPAPDIVATFRDRTVALEVTEIFTRGEASRVPHQAVENYRRRLLEAAAEEWHRRGNPHIETHVHFNGNVDIPRNQISALAARLCDAVVSQLPLSDGYAELEFDWELRNSFLPEQVTAVHVVRFHDAGESHWLAPDAGFVEPLTTARVQHAMNRKLRANYCEVGAESWLVIVADGRRISGSFHIPEAVVQHRYHTQFERVFLLEPFSMRAYELVTQ